MGLLNDLGIGGDFDIAESEKRMESGGLAPEGIHHAVLNGASEKQIDGAKRGFDLVFQILAGPGEGMTVKETVWLPKGEDAKKDQTTKDRFVRFGLHLGLFQEVLQGGKRIPTEIPNKHSFMDCLGAQCFIDVTHEEREWKKDGQAKGKMIKEAKLSFRPGLFLMTDPQCSKIARASGAAVTAAATSAQDQAKTAATSPHLYADV